ncbi:MAG: plasmid mobilization relaxosome protein MobC [Lachnospiraceae bacterium]|nr:plasmid mobilization relaxosome protein MobC [Lachnospiraceae bacterium]MBR4776621.1 plasmid mobilization relaxosome protein MobC [Lachnospiraceae bacterium]
MENRERKNGILLYLNDEELEYLNHKCKLANVKSRSEFIRRLIIRGYVYDVDFSELTRYNYLLSNISSNINQIAHRINETRSIYQPDIDGVKEEMKKLWQLQRSMLSKLPWAKQ